MTLWPRRHPRRLRLLRLPISGLVFQAMICIPVAGFLPDIVAAESEDASSELSLSAKESKLIAEISQDESPEAAPEIEPAARPSAEIATGTSDVTGTARRIHYHAALSVREVYDDNINLSQSHRESDFYSTIEPTIDVSIGSPDANFLSLTYSPNAYIFADHSENNALEHIIAITGQYRMPLLTLSLAQDIQILDGTGLQSASGTGTDFTRTNLDVAGRTRLNIYTTRLNANYSLTGKTFLTGALSYSLSDYPALISSSVVAGNLYFNYTYSPKLAVGIGVAAGYDFVESPSQDQSFEQINGRLSYEVTGKVSATFSAGVEFRQVSGSDENDNGSPVFEGNLFYQPFDGTNLVVTLSRRTLNSAALSSQDFHSTSVIVSARQRFFQRIYLGLSVGYENSSYFNTANTISADRTDDYIFLQASLDLDITRFWTAGIYYFYRESDSSLDLFSFYDNQFGFRTVVNF